MRPPKPPRCFYCEEPSTLLCDFKLGWPIGGYQRGADGVEYAVRALAAPYTCDLPICRSHAQHRGTIHIKAKKPIGGFDTIDFCVEHRGQQDTPSEVMAESEAQRLRRAVHALAERRVTRERGVLRSPPPPPEQGQLF